MKKTIILLFSITLVFLLVACGGGEADQAQEVQNQEGEQFGFSGEMLLQSKLLFGSFILEDTDLAITPEQAEELLPLWKLYRSLVESDTAAEAEIDAVLDSIEDAMTDEQMTTIEEMQFGPEETRQIMEDYDIGFSSRGDEDDTGDFPPEGFPGRFEGVPGQGPGGGQGGGPGGGQGFGGGLQNLSPAQQATAQAMIEERGGGGGRGFFRNPVLIDALIELLEGKNE
jgi:hypothetical protein